MNTKIPTHVGIILDGNRRWAKEKGLPGQLGHKAGYDNVKKLIKYAFSKGVKVLSLYAFSTENFGREKKEVDYLMDIFTKAFSLEKKGLIKNNIKVVFSGGEEPLPKKLIEAEKEIEKLTEGHTGGILNICINYGGRREIVDACKKIINDKIEADNLNEELFSKYLYQDLPDIDLMIRTSGEIRLSNFMLWQNSYAEFYFPKVYFPDFNEKEFDKALEEYNLRNRKFGKDS